MRFLTSRAIRDDSEKPCDEAVRKQVEPFSEQKEYGWFVKLETLGDLMKFIGKYGKVVVDNDDGEATLLIYDDYIEIGVRMIVSI